MKKLAFLTLEADDHVRCYQQLLQFASLRSTGFLLVQRHTIELSDRGQEALVQLAPYQLTAYESSEWPGTSLYGGQTALVRHFRSCPDSINVLATFAASFLEWLQPILPEDLCFVDSNALPVLGVTAHEGYMFSELERSELEKLTQVCSGLKVDEATVPES